LHPRGNRTRPDSDRQARSRLVDIVGNPDLLPRVAKRDQHQVGTPCLDVGDDLGVLGFGKVAVALANVVVLGRNSLQGGHGSFGDAGLAAEQIDAVRVSRRLQVEGCEVGAVEIEAEALAVFYQADQVESDPVIEKDEVAQHRLEAIALAEQIRREGIDKAQADAATLHAVVDRGDTVGLWPATDGHT
jgi:hypothetical protein